MGDRPTVFVVDDDLGSLRSLSWLIQQADLPVRAFSSGPEFLDSFSPEDSGCLVLDMRMPEMDGLEVQKRLKERGIRLPIIFVTAHGDVPSCAQALKAGAVDFLQKPVDHAILLDHLRKALNRSAEQKEQQEFAARINTLTPAEKAVFDLLISGKSLKQIAVARNVSVQTAWKHRAGILQKTGVANGLELVRAATRWAGQQAE